ncbi:hypothetical protein SUGI_0706790 [Cryptomeria japonica]|nr:hypothetical protein SUGI_0706790 [Cryptomeria japonica]
MPTGRINQGEGIKEGAVREVQEETGINTEFVQVVGFRDGHNAPFGKSDLLFVCMLRSLSSNIVVQDTEISVAKQSKLLKDMIGVCVANVNGQCEGFSGIGISSNSRKPSAFFCTALNSE